MRLKKGFTIVELLTVIAVISLLISLLIPSLNMVRNMAFEAKQEVQLAAIDQALLAWRNDFGDYPRSDTTPAFGSTTNFYCGAQKLAEGLLGLDLLGYCPETNWDADILFYEEGICSDLSRRQKRYIELETIKAFLLGDSRGEIPPREGVFMNCDPLVYHGYVLCDVFGRSGRRISVGDQMYKPGLPILYYRANPAGNGLDLRPQNSIYNYWDNAMVANIVNAGGWNQIDFYEFITDEKVSRPLGANPWPYKPDSYILISAGVDGIYGTRDDITNFR